MCGANVNILTDGMGASSGYEVCAGEISGFEGSILMLHNIKKFVQVYYV